MSSQFPSQYGFLPAQNSVTSQQAGSLFLNNGYPAFQPCANPQTEYSPVNLLINIANQQNAPCNNSSADPNEGIMALLLVALLGTSDNNNCNQTDSCSSNDNCADNETASPSKVWGDPHFVFAGPNGQRESVTIQMPAGEDFNLITNTASGGSITGQTGAFNNPTLAAEEGTPSTVFTQTVADLSGGVKVLFNANGTADEINAQGKVIAPLQNGQTVTSGGNSVTYNGTAKTLSYNFKSAAGSVNGTLTATADPRGNYISTGIIQAQGKSFTGILPSLNDTATNADVNHLTGAGAFTPDPVTGAQRTAANFQVPSLYGQ